MAEPVQPEALGPGKDEHVQEEPAPGQWRSCRRVGFLSAEAEGRAVTGAQFCSTMFPGRAPHGQVALALYLGGARAPTLPLLPDSALVALAEQECRELLGARADPTLARVRRWQAGLPQYTLGHCRRPDTFLSVPRRAPGVFVTGNYLTGPSVAACVAQAIKTAEDVLEHLGQGSAKTQKAGHPQGGAGSVGGR